MFLIVNFYCGFGGELLANVISTLKPSVDVMEGDKEIIVSAEPPGMEKKDIDVSVGKVILTIRGEKGAGREEKGRDYYLMERAYGSFIRSIALPAEVAVEEVELQFSKVVLNVRLPKTARAVEYIRKINVKEE